MNSIEKMNQLIVPNTKIKFIAKFKKLIIFLKNLVTNKKFISIIFFAIYPILSYIMIETIQGSNILLDIKYTIDGTHSIIAIRTIKYNRILFFFIFIFPLY